MFVFHKQTVFEIHQKTHLEEKTIHKYLKEYAVKEKEDHKPRPINLIIDTTYFGKRLDGTSWGLMLFRDQKNQENLWWKYVDTETSDGYREGRNFLENIGYTILSVTCDGFKGNIAVFKDIPIQICLFHMKRMIIRGTTLKPKTEAGQVLLAIAQTLTYTTEEELGLRVKKFYFKYQDFLKEKTIHPDGRSTPTHEGVMNAYNSLIYWYKYLFTFHRDRNIPSTTNSCEGHFSHVKDILRIHRGMSFPFKRKVLNSIMLASTISPHRKKKDVQK